MTHDQTNLLVSRNAAWTAEGDLQRRLLEQRKLSLVVDLDQTIIHACIEPTIGEWQRDHYSPNYEAVKDVKKFQLTDDGPRGLASGCWYYIKTRPGLAAFLQRMGELYELHVYTMGTRAYAMNIAKIVDPEQKLFGNRVISRDENGSLTAKSLQRLFPFRTDMVVIIDDRSDVWPNNRHNLIKVSPYDFYKGIGDINSSFLPKRADLLGPPTQAGAPQNGLAANGAAKASVNGAAGNNKNGENISALEELAQMGGDENPALLKKQIEEQARNLEKQIKDRPLLQMQEQLDKEDEATTQETAPNGHEPSQSQSHTRHHLLLDDDNELAYLEKHLTSLHQTFFDEYDARRLEAARASSQGIMDESAGEAIVPNVGTVLDDLKAPVLSGTTIVLSGLVPMGNDVSTSEIGLQTRSFGAQLQTKISRRVTHLVVSSDRPRTQKVRQAAKIPTIKIVNQGWLAACFSQWRKADEKPYLVSLGQGTWFDETCALTRPQSYIHPDDRAKLSGATPNESTDSETISDLDGDNENSKAAKNKGGTKLKLVVSGPRGDVIENDDDDYDDSGDARARTTTMTMLGSTTRDDRSPIEELKTFDWGSADDELAEFLAEEDDEGAEGGGNAMDEEEDDDDGDDDGGNSQSLLVLGAKRKHDEETDSDTNTPAADRRTSGTKKQRVASGLGGSNGLGSTPGEEYDGLPTPRATGDEEDATLPRPQVPVLVLPMEADIDDDQLEADLLAELDAEGALEENG